MTKKLCCFTLAALLPIANARAADPTPIIPPANKAQVVARVNGEPITLDQLMAPLIEGYGLSVLSSLVQLEATRQAAQKNRIECTPEDFQAEREMTIEKMFVDSNAKLMERLDKALQEKRDDEAQRIRDEIKSDNERAFRQFLEQKKTSEVEFNMVIRANAYLRKMAEPLLAGKITEEGLQQAFAALYGETVDCRLIQCATLQEIQVAKERLAQGEPFEKVAMELSRNESTRGTGGKMPSFSRATAGLPEVFKQTAFALKEGDVSDIVQAEGAFHLIKLEKRNPPKAVKFEDVRESIRRDLHDRAVQVTMREMRQQIAEQARLNVLIEDPLLKKQFQDRMTQRDKEIKDQQEMRRQMDRERQRQQGSPDVPTTAPQP